MKQTDKITIAVLGSHSALDICRGAKDMGFKTLVVAQKGRERTYATYYKSKGDVGCVDECLVLAHFCDVLRPDIQKKLLQKNAIFIPNRSFEVYLDFNYKAIETKFSVPMFGNRFLLKLEERTTRPGQYDLLEKAGIAYPRHFKTGETIDRLCLVKLSEKTRSYERAFFLVKTLDDLKRTSQKLIGNGTITRKALADATIEEFVLGPQVNFNFFYSPLAKRLELVGTDTRRQTNLDGMLRLPSPLQADALKEVDVTYEEAGHIAVTVLESLLERAFTLGEKFVKATQTLYPPGIIGPFALQSIITAGPPKKDIIVIDVSARMPGSPAIAATPYSGYLFGQPVSMGKRIAMEIKEASRLRILEKVVT